MHGVAPRREFVSREQFRGERIRHWPGKFFERLINDLAHHARADAADRFVVGDEANLGLDLERQRRQQLLQLARDVDRLEEAAQLFVQLPFLQRPVLLGIWNIKLDMGF